MPSYRRLQQYAIGISILSVIYNGLEGGLSIGFGIESNSRSLIFFGIQSGIEVISALLVVWRFRNVAEPGEERGTNLNSRDLRFEKYGTFGIGLLLVALAMATMGSAVALLALHREPDASNASLIISASALVFMVLIWLPKRFLATALNSSTMRGEATCSLSCIQLTCVLFIGSLVFRVWRGGWWVDGATSIVLSLLFAWEGYKMVKWARDPEFTGGCCDDCQVLPTTRSSSTSKDAELGQSKEIKEKSRCCSSAESSDSSPEGSVCKAEGIVPACKSSCCAEKIPQNIQASKESSEETQKKSGCCSPTEPSILSSESVCKAKSAVSACKSGCCTEKVPQNLDASEGETCSPLPNLTVPIAIETSAEVLPKSAPAPKTCCAGCSDGK